MTIINRIVLSLVVFVVFFIGAQYCINRARVYVQQYTQYRERTEQLIQKGLKLEEAEKEIDRRNKNYVIWAEEYKEWLKRVYMMQHTDLYHEV
jgi:hypothetical protein